MFCNERLDGEVESVEQSMKVFTELTYYYELKSFSTFLNLNYLVDREFGLFLSHKKIGIPILSIKQVEFS